MARRLEGRKFFVNYNNGVTAIISREAMADWLRAKRVIDAIDAAGSHTGNNLTAHLVAANEGLVHLGMPIFAFAPGSRLETQPWFMGHMGLYNNLVSYIQWSGGTVENGSFYVPFSNGSEVGHHGPDALRSEMRHVTTAAQFRETFGVYPHEVEAAEEDLRKQGASARA